MDSLYKTFLWESAYYGIIASVIGSVLGYVCTIFIEAATSDTLQLVAIPVIPILEATLLAVGACLMATAIPLRKISKMSIVDADFSTTMDIYTHITQENMQEKAKNISVNMKLM